jgi:hypothetical protein
MPNCPQCGARNPRENTVCDSCGAVLGVDAPSAAESIIPTPAGELEVLEEEIAEEAAIAEEEEDTEEIPGTRCLRCEAEIAEGEGLIIPGRRRGGGTTVICSKCQEEIEAQFAAETQDIQLPQAVLFGLGAAILTGVAWYLIVTLTELPELAVMAFVGGWFISWAVGYGAGRKRGRTLQIVALGLTAILILGTEYILIGETNLAVFFEEFGKRLQDIFTLLLFGMGLWQAYVSLAPRRLPGAPR